MRTSSSFAAVLILSCTLMAGCAARVSPSYSMNVTSANFADGGVIPADYTCDASGMRPDLQISGAPTDAKSLAVTLVDPDASTNGFVHWVAWNIDPAAVEITSADPLKEATEGLNGAGKSGYYPPCPPSGTHHYIFTVYALSSTLNIPATSTAADLESAMDGKILTQTTLTGLYARTGSGTSSNGSGSVAAMQDTAPGADVMTDSGGSTTTADLSNHD